MAYRKKYARRGSSSRSYAPRRTGRANYRRSGRAATVRGSRTQRIEIVHVMQPAAGGAGAYPVFGAAPQGTVGVTVAPPKGKGKTF